MEKPLPAWFVAEVRSRIGEGQSSHAIARTMTRKYAVVIRAEEIAKAMKQ